MDIFTDEEIDQLVRLVSRHPVLYDAKHADYKNQRMKDNIWKHIAERLDKTSEYCYKRWKTVRSGYIRHKRLNRAPTGLTISKNNRTKWQLYRKLSFLDDVIQERRYVSNADVDNSEPRESPRCDRNEEPYPAIERKHSRVLEYFRDRGKVRQVRLLELEERDEVNSFVRHVGDVLKKLPRFLRIRAKREIFRVITEYEFSVADDNDASDSTTSSPLTPDLGRFTDINAHSEPSNLTCSES